MKQPPSLRTHVFESLCKDILDNGNRIAVLHEITKQSRERAEAKNLRPVNNDER